MSSILDHPTLSQRYFFPSEGLFDDPFWVQCPDGALLGCAYFELSPDAKTVIYFHGNGELVKHYVNWLPPIFHQLGCNLLLAEYRGYGMSDGEPGLVQLLEDVPFIIRSLDQTPEQLVLFGRSVGSLYALEGVKQFPNIGGLILESGVADMVERIQMRVGPAELGCTEEQLLQEVRTQFNHRKKLQGYDGKVLILHAEQDSIVGVHHARQLYQWANEPKELVLFKEGDHNDILYRNEEAYWGKVRGFLDS